MDNCVGQWRVASFPTSRLTSPWTTIDFCTCLSTSIQFCSSITFSTHIGQKKEENNFFCTLCLYTDFMLAVFDKEAHAYTKCCFAHSSISATQQRKKNIISKSHVGEKWKTNTRKYDILVRLACSIRRYFFENKLLPLRLITKTPSARGDISFCCRR